jgi:hypothetical protein
MSDKEEDKISEVVSRQDDWSKYSSRTKETSDVNVMGCRKVEKRYRRGHMIYFSFIITSVEKSLIISK